MELKNYQVDAVEELVAKAKKLLDYPGSKRLSVGMGLPTSADIGSFPRLA